MRIWSLHPKYLDTKGLVALWRETLLAQHVLAGKTKGYKNHPQLDRFKKCGRPLEAINEYLSYVQKEAEARGYNFDKNKIDWTFKKQKIKVTDGQVNYEVKHLLKKLKVRDAKKRKEMRSHAFFDVHPIFRVIGGRVEEWEIVG